MEIDTDAAGILIGEGLDIPTAIAGSLRESSAQPAPQAVKENVKQTRQSGFAVGMLIGIIATVLWLLFA